MLELSGTQNVTGPDNMQMIGFSWPLDLGGRRDARVSVAERELAVKQTQVVDRERRLAADIRVKAGEVLAAARNLKVIDDLIAANRETQRLISQRVAEGAAPALDEQLLLVEITRLEAQRAGQVGRLESLRLQLLPLIGLSPALPVGVADIIERAMAVPPQDGAITRALERRPDLRMARLEERLGEARVDKERAEGRYDASLFTQYQRQDTGFDLMGTDTSGRSRPIQDVFHMVTFGLSITLPVRNRNQGNVTAARAELEGAQRRREATDLMVRQEVASAYAQHEAAARAADIYGRQVLATARRNLDVIRQSYQLGRGSLLDVIAEQRRLIELEVGYTDVLKQRWDAAVDVQRALGAAR
jgi:cobalt-zinc-cadmium efflux system outer membrane protein